MKCFLQTNMEQVENMRKRHETFLNTMDANDEKINSVITFAQKLCDDNHFASDKIHKKAENISERRIANRERAEQQMNKLRDLAQLQQFLQDSEEVIFPELFTFFLRNSFYILIHSV